MPEITDEEYKQIKKWHFGHDNGCVFCKMVTRIEGERKEKGYLARKIQAFREAGCKHEMNYEEIADELLDVRADIARIFEEEIEALPSRYEFTMLQHDQLIRCLRQAKRRVVGEG